MKNFLQKNWQLLIVHKIDTLIFVGVVLFGASYVFQLSGLIPDAILDKSQRPGSVWFQADITRVVDNMTLRLSNHYRTKVHPLFSLIAYPPTFLLQKLGFSALIAVRSVISVTGGLFLGTLFVVLIVSGLRRLDAAIFTGLASVSASFIFMATVPETFVFGALTILIVMLVTGMACRTTVSRIWQTAANAISLSVTVTNWMTGILSAFFLNDWKRCIRICRDGFVIVTLLWGIEKIVFPSAEYFLNLREEANYILMNSVGGPLERTILFFLHSMVMPAVDVLNNPYNAKWPLLSIEHSSLFSHSLIGISALLLWACLLVAGIVAAFRSKSRQYFFLMVGGATVGQLLLHLVYGDETFLYALNWLPLLIALAAAGALMPCRGLVLAAATALTILLGVYNLGRFAETTSLLSTYGPAFP